MDPLSIIKEFDLYLAEKGLFFDAIIIGGAALSILGVISRQTQDVDVLDPKIPENILSASKEFAHKFNLKNTTLNENWLNHGPESLRNYLRPRWKARVQHLWQGKAIHLQTLGRVDLIGTKILAYCDRGQDLKDCLDMKPTKEELLEILPWVKGYDTNTGWPDYVQGQVEFLAKRLGYEL